MGAPVQTIARALTVVVVAGGLTFGHVVGAAASSSRAAPVAAPTPTVTLSDRRTISRWAHARQPATVRAAPSTRARAVGRLRFLTEDDQAEVYLALRKRRVGRADAVWIEVALPQRPNGTTGWVRAGALARLHVVRGRLVVRRSQLRATLYDGSERAIWSAPVAIGAAATPTPAGRFYVREKLRAIGTPDYGPYAIGTSAYAPTLSDWPGGGVVGVHGTNEPQLIPGRPSHGCIRLRNDDVTRLWRLIAIGTPVEVV